MRLVTFLPTKARGEPRLGVLHDDGVVDLTAADPVRFASMLSLIDGGGAALDAARQCLSQPAAVLAMDAVRLLAPLPEPRQMRDHMAFEEHLRRARSNRHLIVPGTRPVPPEDIEILKIWYDQPLYYKCNRFAVTGPGTDILWPSYSQVIDYELELGIVIGRKGKNIQAAEAASYIFGYCIFNDFSARDAQIPEMGGQLGPAKGKDFDTANAIGPWLVTADEVANPYNLTMRARVNGKEWSCGNSGSMYHRFEAMIEHVSRDETVYPGEFFGSGTVGGGCGLELGRFLSVGDVIELEIDGLGVLRNRITRA